MCMLGKPPDRCTSTVIRGASTPVQPRLCTSDNPITRPPSGLNRPGSSSLQILCVPGEEIALEKHCIVCGQFNVKCVRFIDSQHAAAINPNNLWSQTTLSHHRCLRPRNRNYKVVYSLTGEYQHENDSSDYKTIQT